MQHSKGLRLFCVVLVFSMANSTIRERVSNIIEFFPNISDNLTQVTWAHAVNNRSYLESSLESDVMMLEADIVLGTLTTTSDSTEIPIMGHPPANSSDLSFEDFLLTVQEHNLNSTENRKGVKLDFKTIEVFEASLDILHQNWSQMDFPVWINADIVEGPLNATTIPVDPVRFLNGSSDLENATLSLGWTTNYGGNITSASYTDDQIQSMLDVITENNVTQAITFPVRAGIAAESLSQMQALLDGVPGSTLTIWSSSGDEVNIENLRTLIFTIGVEKIYLDVPEEVSSQLHLDSPPSGTTDGANMHTLSLLSILVVGISILLKII